MKILKIVLFSFITSILGISCGQLNHSNRMLTSETMMIRIAEIEIDSVYIEHYLSILQEEAAASVRLEPGVLCIYPMFEKENPLQIRLLEIYANKKAYESHLQTPHFKHYKTTTRKMVKSLKLIDMEPIDNESMSEIFKRINL